VPEPKNILAVPEWKNNPYRSPDQEVCTRTGEFEAVSNLYRSPEREVLYKNRRA
jgi:hypothetical protein